MEAFKLLCYKSWSIKIECHSYDPDPQHPVYASTATVTFMGERASAGLRPAERFVAHPPGITFPNSHEANLAMQYEAKRRIDELPVHLPVVLAARM